MFFPSKYCYTSSCPMITYQLVPKYNKKLIIPHRICRVVVLVENYINNTMLV